MSDQFVRLTSTFFYVGMFPAAPGSLASLAGAFIAVILSPNIPIYLVVTAAVTVLGFLVSGSMEKILNEKDPSCIVIDEVAGVLIAFFLLPLDIPTVVTAYFLFRAFDMFKIYPVNLFERLEGSWGIMMDDIVAGIYTNLTMHAALWVIGRGH